MTTFAAILSLKKNHFNLSGAHVVWILGDLHVRGLLDQSWPMAVRGGEILLTLLFSSVENFLHQKVDPLVAGEGRDGAR